MTRLRTTLGLESLEYLLINEPIQRGSYSANGKAFGLSQHPYKFLPDSWPFGILLPNIPKFYVRMTTVPSTVQADVLFFKVHGYNELQGQQFSTFRNRGWGVNVVTPAKLRQDVWDDAFTVFVHSSSSTSHT